MYQRPQHLMSILSQSLDVTFWEEPIEAAGHEAARLQVTRPCANVTVVTPRLPAGLSAVKAVEVLRGLLDDHLAGGRGRPICWYYTPMMLAFSRHIDASCIVYDCMDELASFRFAPADLAALERDLFEAADLVFTGGHSLYEAKRTAHPAVYPFPSSVDAGHFARAREVGGDPLDQVDLPAPRFGFYGVIDERMDLDLVAALADARPGWTLVLVGPVVKIDPGQLPQRPNIVYLGGKSYGELPSYAGGWDVALMPFAINESTRFISPTKTPEYLAAGLPVVSTPIIDVARHYGELDAVEIASGPEAFVAACERALRRASEPAAPWRDAVEQTLAELSWDSVAAAMMDLVQTAMAARERAGWTGQDDDRLIVGESVVAG